MLGKNIVELTAAVLNIDIARCEDSGHGDDHLQSLSPPFPCFQGNNAIGLKL